MSGQRVCVHEVSAERLEPGSIVVSGGRARYLAEKLGTVCGYDNWAYTAYDESGEAHHGRMSVRADASVSVVAQLTDGSLITA